jgi:hypothetical protein
MLRPLLLSCSSMVVVSAYFATGLYAEKTQNVPSLVLDFIYERPLVVASPPSEARALRNESTALTLLADPNLVSERMVTFSVSSDRARTKLTWEGESQPKVAWLPLDFTSIPSILELTESVPAVRVGFTPAPESDHVGSGEVVVMRGRAVHVESGTNLDAADVAWLTRLIATYEVNRLTWAEAHAQQEALAETRRLEEEARALEPKFFEVRAWPIQSVLYHAETEAGK